jgi:hypothetical protein
MHALSIFWIILLGFVLGMRHATDPDHIIAVSTIVTRYRNIQEASFIGSLWGVGHTFTIIVVGGGIVLLDWVIPARLGLSMELSVGLMLVSLGVLNLSGMPQWIRENIVSTVSVLPVTMREVQSECFHLEAHSSNLLHSHDQPPLKWLDGHLRRLGFYHVIRPLIVGVVHGLAGSAAVSLLVLATIREPVWAISYLAVFGVGTIAGMMLITAAMAASFGYCRKFPRRVNSGFRFVSGLISLSFGLLLVYKIVIVSGLFSTQTRWTPH